jgi:hypothetical protein
MGAGRVRWARRVDATPKRIVTTPMIHLRRRMMRQ